MTHSYIENPTQVILWRKYRNQIRCLYGNYQWNVLQHVKLQFTIIVLHFAQLSMTCPPTFGCVIPVKDWRKQAQTTYFFSRGNTIWLWSFGKTTYMWHHLSKYSVFGKNKIKENSSCKTYLSVPKNVNTVYLTLTWLSS